MANKLQRLNSLNYQALKLLESYSDIFNGNYGLAIEYGNFLATICTLIEKEEVEQVDNLIVERRKECLII